jgi:hypothetical protein
MREIKFRARPCYYGGKQPQWVYGTFQYIAQRRVNPGATDNGTLVPRVDKGCIVNIYGVETEVLCDTLGQFTGLYDKNGKEVYEGDIVKCNEFVYRVVFNDKRFASFGLRRKADVFMHYFGEAMESQQCEVIGNIHDNQELLKQ